MPGSRLAIGLLLGLLLAGGVAPAAGAGSVASAGQVPATGAAPVADARPAASAGPAAGARPATAITPGSVDRTSIDLTATYAVDMAVRYSDRAFRLDTTIAVLNTSNGPIDRLELNTVAAKLGGIRLYRVTIDGRTVTGSVRIDDQTLIVPLGGILEPGASTSVRVIFHARLRATTTESDWFFTRANGVIELYRAIPWISMVRPFGRENHGDPFVTPSSPFVTLKLTTDRPMVVALNGVRTSVSANGRIQTFESRNVRDLPIVMGPDLRVTTGQVGTTTVRVYGRAGAPFATLLANARRSVERIGELVGPYPWPTLTVVQSAGGYAMEGPGTIWIPRTASAGSLPYLVAHETAHQWFPGLVGNDQWSDPFADEAVADMIARTILNQRRASRCTEGSFDGSILDYPAECYYEVIYIQGGNWLNDLRLGMGSSAFWEGLRRYIDEHRFGIGSSRALLDTLDAASPVDVAAIAAPRFPNTYRVAGALGARFR